MLVASAIAKIWRPLPSLTSSLKRSVGAAAFGAGSTAEISKLRSGTSGPRSLAPPAGSQLGRRDARISPGLRSPRLRLAHAARSRSSAKKPGTVRSIASPPEIPSQLALTIPTKR